MLVYGVQARVNGRLRLLGCEDGAERYRLLDIAVVATDREVFLARSPTGELALRSVETGAVLQAFGAFGGEQYRLSPDRRWLATFDIYVSRVQVWDLTTQTLRHTLTPADISTVTFREDSAALLFSGSQSAQSGNQDWNTEAVYDVQTGACLETKGYWDQDAEPTAPLAIAPGVTRDGDRLTVDGHILTLPTEAIVHVAASGRIVVASVSSQRLELHEVERRRPYFI